MYVKLVVFPDSKYSFEPKTCVTLTPLLYEHNDIVYTFKGGYCTLVRNCYTDYSRVDLFSVTDKDKNGEKLPIGLTRKQIIIDSKFRLCMLN